MKVTFIENEPEYKVGDIAVDYNYIVFEITGIEKEDIPDWQKEAVQRPSYMGGLLGTEDREAYLYRYLYLGKDGAKHYAMEAGTEGINKAFKKLLAERDSYKKALDNVYQSVEDFYPSDI